MKTLLGILAAAAVVLAMMVLAGLAWQIHLNSQLKRTNETLMTQLDLADKSTAALTEENASLAEQLKDLETMEDELRTRVESLEADAETLAKARPTPYRVRAFVGQETVGGAWIIPHNVTLDEELGRYLYEPILMIDESAKKHFTVHHTNVVEREVYRTEVYQDGYNYPYYYYVTQGRPGKPTRPPNRPDRPTPIVSTSPSGGSQPNANARVFAPPNSIVNTRPQVIGTPATAPVNARVFAP